MPGRLEGKTAIITGAAGGIGSPAARLFCHEGACVLATYVTATVLMVDGGRYVT
jgi:3alpha(or 20beta)-hydroxysteroid dehydrogenase